MKTRLHKVIGYTDYPIGYFGDVRGAPAPIRRVRVIAYDRDKYVEIVFLDEKRLPNYPAFTTIKAGYVYRKPGRVTEVRPVPIKQLSKLPRIKWDDGQ